MFDEIGDYVRALFEEHPSPLLLYHDLNHTLSVVGHAATIADHYTLNDTDRFILITASYFHDTGHLLGYMEGHEKISVEIMRDFFNDKDTIPAEADTIAACILATEWSARPQTLLEAIIRDADTFHLGMPDFFDQDKRVWDEMEARTGKPVDHRTERTLRFMQVHRFYTDYCQALLNPGKQHNMETLRSTIPNFK